MKRNNGTFPKSFGVNSNMSIGGSRMIDSTYSTLYIATNIVNKKGARKDGVVSKWYFVPNKTKSERYFHNWLPVLVPGVPVPDASTNSAVYKSLAYQKR